MIKLEKTEDDIIRELVKALEEYYIAENGYNKDPNQEAFFPEGWEEYDNYQEKLSMLGKAVDEFKPIQTTKKYDEYLNSIRESKQKS